MVQGQRLFNTQTNEMSNWLECGKGTDGKTVLSNPDCIEIARLGGKKYLIIHFFISTTQINILTCAKESFYLYISFK